MNSQKKKTEENVAVLNLETCNIASHAAALILGTPNNGPSTNITIIPKIIANLFETCLAIESIERFDFTKDKYPMNTKNNDVIKIPRKARYGTAKTIILNFFQVILHH